MSHISCVMLSKWGLVIFRKEYEIFLYVKGRLLAAPIKLKKRGASYAFIGATFTGGARKPPYIEQASIDPGKGPLKFSPMLGFSYKPKRKLEFNFNFP